MNRDGKEEGARASGIEKEAGSRVAIARVWIAGRGARVFGRNRKRRCERNGAEGEATERGKARRDGDEMETERHKRIPEVWRNGSR